MWIIFNWIFFNSLKSVRKEKVVINDKISHCGPIISTAPKVGIKKHKKYSAIII